MTLPDERNSGRSAATTWWPFSRREKLLWDRWCPNGPYLVVLALAACLLVPQVVLLGKLPDHYDFWLQEYVHLVYLHHWLHAGEIPLWNGQLALGTPHLADPQAAVLYPLTTLPLLVLTPAFVERLSIPFHIFLASAGTYAYARRLGQSRPAATAAGLAYSLAPHFAPIELPTYLQQSAAWFPLILWTLETGYGRRQLAWFAASGACWAMQLFRGAAQTWYVTGVAVAIICLSRTLAVLLQDRKLRDRSPLIGPLVFVAIGLGLGAAQLLPSFELMQHSQRSEGFTLAEASGPGRVSLPNLLGAPGPDAEVSGAFPGGAVLALALAALHYSRGAALWTHAAGAVAALGLCLGSQAPLWAIAYRLLPGFAALHMPHRLLFLWSFCLAVLVGLGLDALARRPNLRPLLLTACALLACLWLGTLRGDVPADALAGLRQLATGIVAVALVGVASRQTVPVLGGPAAVTLAALVGLDLLGHSLPRLYGRFYSPDAVYAPPPAARWLMDRTRAAAEPIRFASATYNSSTDTGEGSRLQDNRRLAYLPPNVPALYPGLEAAQGYLAIHLRRSGELLDAINDLGRNPRVLSIHDPRSRLLDRLGIRYFVTDDVERFPSTVAGGQSLTAAAGTVAIPVRDPLRTVELELLSSLGDSIDVADGEEVARLALVAADGRELVLPVRAGEHTAEWLYDTPSAAGRVRHRMAPVAHSQPRGDGSQARVYRARFDLAAENSPVIREIRLAVLNPRVRWNVDRVVLHTRFSDRFRLAYQDGPLRVWENLDAQPRAFGPDAAADWRSQTANTRTLDVTARRPTQLAISEVYDAGWQATVDGQPATLREDEHGLLAVSIPEGMHRVRLTYLPASVAWGSAVSGASLALLLGWAGLGIISRRSHPLEAGPNLRPS